MTVQEKNIIKATYFDIVQTLREVEVVYNKNKRNQKNRSIFEFVAAKEQVLYELCCMLKVNLYNET